MVRTAKKKEDTTVGASVMLGGIAGMLDVPQSAQEYYLLIDDISYESVRPVIEWILACNFSTEKKPKLLTLLICSPGGSLSACMALIDVMKGSKIPIATVAIGEIASAGTFITMSGTKGMRFCTTNTLIMSHTYSATTGFQKHHELIAAMKSFDLMDAMIVRHYMKCTGLTDEEVRRHLLPDSDVFLTPDEARNFGIVDHVHDLD